MAKKIKIEKSVEVPKSRSLFTTFLIIGFMDSKIEFEKINLRDYDF